MTHQICCCCAPPWRKSFRLHDGDGLSLFYRTDGGGNEGTGHLQLEHARLAMREATSVGTRTTRLRRRGTLLRRRGAGGPHCYVVGKDHTAGDELRRGGGSHRLQLLRPRRAPTSSLSVEHDVVGGAGDVGSPSGVVSSSWSSTEILARVLGLPVFSAFHLSFRRSARVPVRDSVEKTSEFGSFIASEFCYDGDRAICGAGAIQ